jgi:poly(3-hydroxybutyrate) depolymerase
MPRLSHPETITAGKPMNEMTPGMTLTRRISRLGMLGWMASACLANAGALSGYNIDPARVTVSGISSGGAMAAQVHVAYSATFKGVAMFAGAAYDCAEGNLAYALGRCMNAVNAAEIPVTRLAGTTVEWARQGLIDDPANLAQSQVYLFSGTLDAIVHQPGMDAARDYYLQFMAPANITYDNATPAGHGWISQLGPNPCAATQSPYVNNCGVDPEQTFLSRFYGTLEPKAAGALSGKFLTVDQAEFLDDRNPAGHSVDANGWVYVPASCAQGKRCGLHVAFHGCNQGYSQIGDQFFRRTALNEWADTNKLVVLYPQAVPTVTARIVNGQGCWDWWGYDQANYAQRKGPQMLMTKRMVDRIMSGYRG